MSAREKDLINTVLLSATKLGARLFRQNVGTGWIGRIVGRIEGGRITLADARPLHAGLCRGSSDVIGWTPVIVTPDMVGRTVAIFTAIEIKTGRVTTTPEQAAFVAAVKLAGGYAGVARSEAEALAILNR